MNRMTTVAALIGLTLASVACSDVDAPATQLCADASTRCDDNNECTFDDCDPATGTCLYANAPEGTECSSGGEDATCSAGVCGVSSEAVAFCEGYEETCGFSGGVRYADKEACQAEYDGFSSDKQNCVEQHLGFARAENDPGTHCPHATGRPPCDI